MLPILTIERRNMKISNIEVDDNIVIITCDNPKKTEITFEMVTVGEARRLMCLLDFGAIDITIN